MMGRGWQGTKLRKNERAMLRKRQFNVKVRMFDSVEEFNVRKCEKL